MDRKGIEGGGGLFLKCSYHRLGPSYCLCLYLFCKTFVHMNVGVSVSPVFLNVLLFPSAVLCLAGWRSPALHVCICTCQRCGYVMHGAALVKRDGGSGEVTFTLRSRSSPA